MAPSPLNPVSAGTVTGTTTGLPLQQRLAALKPFGKMRYTAPTSIFIGDLCPCPVQGLCERHKSLLGNADEKAKTPHTAEWDCEPCGHGHPKVLKPTPHVQASSPTIKSRIEQLPPELVRTIQDHLDTCDQTLLSLTSETMQHIIGDRPWQQLSKRREPRDEQHARFLNILARELPDYGVCVYCGTLQPYTSSKAWPLLKRNRAYSNGLSPLGYSVSNFLAQKVIKFYQGDRVRGLCMSVVECGGTYKKTYAVEDKENLEKVGLDALDVDEQLPIHYRAYGRIGNEAEDGGQQHNKTKIKHGPPLITHVQYKIELPKEWKKLHKAEREAVFRGLPLCAHINAMDFGTDDLVIPTKAEDRDRATAQGLRFAKDRVLVTKRCTKCAVEAQFDPGPGYKLTLDVWRYYEALMCNDGIPCGFHRQVQSSPASGPREVFDAAKDLFGMRELPLAER